MSEHRVASHLGLAASDYDAQIRRYIPEYEAMLATVVELVAGLRAESVVDLGAGTGALGGAILDAVPSARVRLVDIDPHMLEVARARVGRHGDRAEPVRASFADPLPSNVDAVVASLSLHHIANVDEKRAIYARIHAALRPGGLVAIADCVVHADGAERARAFGVWREWMARRDIPGDEAQRLFDAWADEDFYQPLSIELDLLRDAGFARSDCFWKYGPIAVYGAYRDA